MPLNENQGSMCTVHARTKFENIVTKVQRSKVFHYKLLKIIQTKNSFNLTGLIF